MKKEWEQWRNTLFCKVTTSSEVITGFLGKPGTTSQVADVRLHMLAMVLDIWYQLNWPRNDWKKCPISATPVIGVLLFPNLCPIFVFFCRITRHICKFNWCSNSATHSIRSACDFKYVTPVVNEKKLFQGSNKVFLFLHHVLKTRNLKFWACLYFSWTSPLQTEMPPYPMYTLHCLFAKKWPITLVFHFRWLWKII